VSPPPVPIVKGSIPTSASATHSKMPTNQPICNQKKIPQITPAFTLSASTSSPHKATTSTGYAPDNSQLSYTSMPAACRLISRISARLFLMSSADLHLNSAHNCSLFSSSFVAMYFYMHIVYYLSLVDTLALWLYIYHSSPFLIKKPKQRLIQTSHTSMPTNSFNEEDAHTLVIGNKIYMTIN
jgi:hypothetical protein